MARVDFREIKMKKTVSGKCTVCGKPMKKTVSCSQTVNPWNKDPETGLPRTEQQVCEAVKEELSCEVAEYQNNPGLMVHDKCR